MRRRHRTKLQLLKVTSDRRKEKLISQLIQIEKEIKESHRIQLEDQERNDISSIERNPKYFFSYAKRFSKVRTGIGPLIDAGNALVACPQKMAEILSQQYSKVFSTPKHPKSKAEELFDKEGIQKDTITNIMFCEEDLIEAMEEISYNSAAGPDGYPAILLKNCRQALSRPLYIIWRQSMNTGVIPKLCKFAHIVPIYKGKSVSRSTAKSYRPVALTSQLIKTFEKVVRRHIVAFMEKHSLFNISQHGFRMGRSCLSQLIEHLDHVNNLLEQGKSVDVIYLDFAKAFDKVDIEVTLRKMKDLGIQGKLGRWIHSFLNDREQAVTVDKKISKPQPVKSGVPQGSVLGPLIFLILIGDIDQNISSAFLSSFADDTRVGKGIETEQDVRDLQDDLNSVYTWAKNNNMEFNSDKFELLRYRVPGALIQDQTFYKADNGDMIEEKYLLRNLGITISNDASFTTHIQERIEALKSKVGWVLRTFRARDPKTMLTLWKQLIQPDHDYCCQLWSPEKIWEIQDIEVTLRSFLRKIHGMSSVNYWEQLQKLQLYSLQRRRERYISIYVWKMLEGLAPNTSSSGSQHIGSSWHIRHGRLCHIPVVPSRTPGKIKAVRYSSITVRGPRLFNALPQSIRNMTGCTVDLFKNNLDALLRKLPDEPPIPGYSQFRCTSSNSLTDILPYARNHGIIGGSEPIPNEGVLISSGGTP